MTGVQTCALPISQIWNCGWCYGGFKATPASGWTFAHTIAQDKVHELNAGFSLNRFSTGHLIDEKGLGTKTWIS